MSQDDRGDTVAPSNVAPGVAPNATPNTTPNATPSLASSTPPLSEEAAQALLLSLRQKQGTWVDWGMACRQLHQAGYEAPVIFEATGIEASYQNLVIVASQVYDSLVKAGAADTVLSYFRGPKSDVLYEFRVLNQTQRLAAAELAQAKTLDVDEAHQVVKAIQAFARLAQIPPGFANHPGDAVAYHCWKLARTKKDIQERSRLIARGLKFAHSPAARQQIEKLLTDFTVVPSRQAPLLPIHRLEQEEELPRIVPVVGRWPVTLADWQAVPLLEEQEPFRLVSVTRTGVLVPVPGWPVLLKAEDPVALLCQRQQLPQAQDGPSEQVLVLVDRASRTWNPNAYFVVEQRVEQPGEQVGESSKTSEPFLVLQWFEEEPTVSLLGQLLLVLRPKRILDENVITEPWQMDD